jgi:hypothetical protein
MYRLDDVFVFCSVLSLGSRQNLRPAAPAGLRGGTCRARKGYGPFSLLRRTSLLLCRFYGASGEEIISIGADVHRMTEPLHATAA